jgi:hypothetical protein
MGHDILAGEFDEQRLEKIRSQLGQTVMTLQQFEDRFEGCGDFAATLRRSAYDKHNKVLYRALGAEELYTGASGNSETKVFTRAEIEAARRLLPSIVADKPPPIDTRYADELRDVIAEIAKGFGAKEEDNLHIEPWADGGGDVGIKLEEEFLNQTLRWMDSEDKKFVEIYFG